MHIYINILKANILLVTQLWIENYFQGLLLTKHVRGLMLDQQLGQTKDKNVFNVKHIFSNRNKTKNNKDKNSQFNPTTIC